ncbi:MAG: glycosyltransferase family 2 protein [Acutalibacteraceae bacterium]
MKISIITTIYKAEKDLPRLLESMMAQKSPELEFFLIDNGSPDNCGEVCNEYAKKDSRFTVYTLKDNIGYIRARNLGIQKCSGDYVGFCDSDDYLENGGYDRAIEKIYETQCDLYLTSYRTIFTKREEINLLPYECGLYKNQQVQTVIRPQAFGRLPGKGVLHGFAWKQIFRKSIILDNRFEFMPELQPYEDQLFNTDIIGKCNSVYVDDNVIYNYIVNEQSITAKLLADFDSSAEWGRIALLYKEKLKRAKNQAEIEANCNESLEKIYEYLLNLAKQNKTVRQIKSTVCSDLDKTIVSEVLKDSSKKLSGNCTFVRSCLRLKLYSIMIACLKSALYLRKKIR